VWLKYSAPAWQVQAWVKTPVSRVYCSAIHYSEDMETAKMPHYWQMDQENGILCSHEEERNVIMHW
jgi:hypothetical protein